MLSLALRTLRARWTTFVSTFIALALGVALVAAMGQVLAGTLTAPARAPQRYAEAPLVITPIDQLRVPTAQGIATQKLASSPGLPPDLVARVAALGPAIPDRTFYAQLASEDGAQIGRPWPLAAYGGYRLISGRAPAADDEIVVGAQLGPNRPGDQVVVLTAEGPGSYTVVGVTAACRLGERRQRGEAAPPCVTAGCRLEERSTDPAASALSRRQRGGAAPPCVTAGCRLEERSTDPAASALSRRQRGEAAPPCVTAAVRFERALFFSGAEAARLSPRVDALISLAPVEQVRRVLEGGAEIRTGARLRELDPDLRRDNEALVAANALVGTAGGIAGFVSIFVVASTFAYAVMQRRRELALLRMAGATPGQVRRLVLAEAAFVGVLASAAGCALGALAGPRLAARLVDLGFAPSWFTVPATATPLVVAYAVGLAAALLGAWTSARNASRIRPAEALRESAAQRRGMSLSRWVGGVTTAGAALAMLAMPIIAAPGDALKRKHYVPEVMLLLVAFALLAPVLVPPVARLIGRPLGRLRGATGLLVSRGAYAAARRTAATAAPVVLTLGLAACLMGITATIEGAKVDEARNRLGGDYLVVPSGAPVLNRAVVERVRAVDGVDALAVYPTTVYDLEEETVLVQRAAYLVDQGGPHDLLRLPVIAGSVALLREDTIVVDREWGRQVGDVVRIWYGDGTPATLRVVAVIAQGVGGNGAYLTTGDSRPATAERIHVGLRPGADPVRVSAALDEATRGMGATAVTTADHTTAIGAGKNRAGELGLRVMLGVCLLFALLSVAGTTLMAARDRGPELALLRLTGATMWQALRVVAAETLLVVLFGVVLAAGAAMLALGTLWLAMMRLSGPFAVVVPWRPIIVVAAACAGVALLASVLPAVVSLSRRTSG